MQGKRWVFTHPNPSADDHVAHIWDKAEAGGFGYEVAPTTGLHHMQGWVSFPSNMRLTALKKSFCPTCHWEVMRGTEEDSHRYCSKEGRYYGYGRPPSAARQGQRRDLEEAIAAYEEGGKKKACAEHPEAMAKYFKGVEYVIEGRKDPYQLKPLDHLHPWQAELYEFLEGEPDDRTIVWVRDTVGGKGKSAFVRHLIATRGAIQLEGKVADMAYGYNYNEIVCFDITRAQAEMSDHLYTFAEKLKNGFLVSTKYETKMKAFKPPHVIFLANRDCPAGMFSADRVKLIDLD
jgi:hypothetical protein